MLVVEDDYFIADEICAALRAHDAEIVGPAPDVGVCMDLMRDEQIDCAVLDINLHGTLAYPIAVELKRRSIPAVFATGYSEVLAPLYFNQSLWLEKPLDLQRLLHALCDFFPRAKFHADASREA